MVLSSSGVVGGGVDTRSSSFFCDSGVGVGAHPSLVSECLRGGVGACSSLVSDCWCGGVGAFLVVSSPCWSPSVLLVGGSDFFVSGSSVDIWYEFVVVQAVRGVLTTSIISMHQTDKTFYARVKGEIVWISVAPDGIQIRIKKIGSDKPG